MKASGSSLVVSNAASGRAPGPLVQPVELGGLPGAFQLDDRLRVLVSFIARIRRWGRGAAFTPKDFVDLAPRGTVDMTLRALLDASAHEIEGDRA